MKSSAVTAVMNLFEQLSPTQRLKVADRINEKTFAEQWERLDKSLPDAALSDEEVLRELTAVRNAK